MLTFHEDRSVSYHATFSRITEFSLLAVVIEQEVLATQLYWSSDVCSSDLSYSRDNILVTGVDGNMLTFHKDRLVSYPATF